MNVRADVDEWPVVVVESPYAGDVERNLAYARAAVRDCIERGEIPIASHLLYTQPGILNDNTPGERSLGIRMGLEVAKRLKARTVFYTDLGISPGMENAGFGCMLRDEELVCRSLPEWKSAEANDVVEETDG